MKLDNIKTENAFDYAYLLKRIFPYIKPVLGRIILAFILVIPLGLLDGVTAFVLKPYIDVVVNGDTLEYFGKFYYLTTEKTQYLIQLQQLFQFLVNYLH